MITKSSKMVTAVVLSIKKILYSVFNFNKKEHPTQLLNRTRITSSQIFFSALCRDSYSQILKNYNLKYNDKKLQDFAGRLYGSHKQKHWFLLPGDQQLFTYRLPFPFVSRSLLSHPGCTANISVYPHSQWFHTYVNITKF